MPIGLLRPAELASSALDWTGRWRGRDIWDILTAARDGDLPRLTTLLSNDRSIANAEYWYTPPLHFAVREGRRQAVQMLVEAGANLAYRNLYGGETLPQMALDRGHQDVADYLSEQLRSRLDAEGGKHAIHEAVAAGDLPRLSQLIDDDPQLVHRGDPLGRKPLHYAAAGGRRDMVDLLLAHGADIDAQGFRADDRLGGDGFRPVALALWHHGIWRQRNDYAMVRHLLDNGANYSMTVAAALGDETRVRQLLNRDRSLADTPEPGGKRPLSAAAERNHETIVRLLLDAGANPNLAEGADCPQGYALWAASHFGHRQIAELLLEAGADPNALVESSGSPTESAADPEMRVLLYRYGGRLSLAAHYCYGNTDAIAALLEAKPELFDERAAAEGFTHAVKSDNEALVRLLLARGLRVPQVVTCCQTYLWSSPTLTRILLEHEMDPDLPNWQQMRPLHHLAAQGDVAGAKLFLEFGADPQAIDEEYRSTPLGWAARNGQTEFVRFWLEATKDRADAAPTDVPPWAQPRAWASRRGHDAIVGLLDGSPSAG